MEVHVLLDEQGMLPDAYAKYCAPEDKQGWPCVRSFPFEVTDVPAETKALAWVFIDWDSIPVCGYPWMHWCAWMAVEPEDLADGMGIAIPDDASRIMEDVLHQGFNSAAKNPDRDKKTGYVGPCPPNEDHVYTLAVAALDAEPDFAPYPGEETFWTNQLVKFAKAHALASATIDLPSRC